MAARLTQEQFIEKCTKIHNGKYLYDKAVYQGSKKPITIGCPTHGYFEQHANGHLQGMGCKDCANASLGLGQEKFLERCKKAHGDRYDYSKVVYKTNRTKVIIGCSRHGDFEQEPAWHLGGNGCKKCTFEDKTMSNDQWKEIATKTHNGKYNYDKVVYVKSTEKVTINCLLHGDFIQEANSHLRGHGCAKCQAEKATVSLEDFKKRAKEVHGDFYDYSKSTQVSGKEKLIVTCPVHGDFKVRVDQHLAGYKCKECAIAKSMTSEAEFIARVKDVHADKYDYSETEYKGANADITVKCPVHGPFNVRSANHLVGSGCAKCGSVYLLQSTDGLYKFGNSNGPLARVATVNSASNMDFELLHHVDIKDIDKARICEDILLRLMRDARAGYCFTQYVTDTAWHGSTECFYSTLTEKQLKRLMDNVLVIYAKSLLVKPLDVFEAILKHFNISELTEL